MKKLFILLFLLLSAKVTIAQSIRNIDAYFKLDGTRYIAQMSDNSLWWFAQNAWQEIPKNDLPDKEIKFIDAYLKYGLGLLDTRIVCVLADNSIWWYDNEENWEEAKKTGLPAGHNITDFNAYVKIGNLSTSETRFVAVLQDKSIWWFAPNKNWEPVPMKDFPKDDSVIFLRTYQKMGMMGSDTRYVVKLKSNEIWWCDGSKWKKFEENGLPKNQAFKQFEIYMKPSGALSSLQEGRFVAVLENESIWWCAVSGKSWTKLDTKGLPEAYKIKSLKAYQKYGGLTGETRLLILLEDGSLWWYAYGKSWTAVPMKGLGQN